MLFYFYVQAQAPARGSGADPPQRYAAAKLQVQAPVHCHAKNESRPATGARDAI
jgi:hypothetical protein